MMDFDKRDEVIKKISENGTMYQKLQQMGQVLEQLAAMVTDYTGRKIYSMRYKAFWAALQ